MNPFELLVHNLSRLGFFGFLLPWILVFAIFYGLLKKSGALGDDEKIIAMVSLTAAFFVIGYGAVPVGEILSSLFASAIIVIAGILVAILFIGMAGFDIKDVAENKVIMWGLLGIAILVFMSVGALTIFRIGAARDIILTIIILIFLGVIVYVITKE